MKCECCDTERIPDENWLTVIRYNSEWRVVEGTVQGIPLCGYTCLWLWAEKHAYGEGK